MEDSAQKKRKLLEQDSDDESQEDLHTLKVNKKFARKFEEKHRRNDLYRAKERGLLDGSSDEEEEDEKGDALTKSLDVDIMKTISMIRKKDKRIYDKSFKPFTQSDDEDSDESDDKGDRKSKSKPYTYKDMIRQKAQKAMNDEDSDEEDSDAASDEEKDKDPSYVEKQKKLKEAFKLQDEEDDDDDEILQLKVKSKLEKQKEDDDFATFVNSVKQSKKATAKLNSNMDVLASYFKEPANTEEEKFLRSFVLNKGWVSKHSISDDEEEDSQNDAEEKSNGLSMGDADDEEDLEQLEKAEEFETKYNFRFEEPGSHEIKSYPRNVESVRREKNPRKRRREARKKRKAELKQQQAEEIKRLKNLKKKELQARLEKARSAAGLENQSLLLTEKDMDDGFDPEKHDAMMQKMFGDEYYEKEDKDFEKPDISDLIDEGDEWEDDAANDDAANDDAANDDDTVQAEDNEEAKGQSLEEKHIDELRNMDYEGTIGDMKTRFKYKKVKPESWGLTSEEILDTEDTVLNEYVSLKKIVPYLGFDWKVTQKRRRRFRQRVKEAQLTKKEKKEKEKRKLKKQQEKAKSVEVEQDNKETDLKDVDGEKTENVDAISAVDEKKKKRKRKRKKKKKEAASES